MLMLFVELVLAGATADAESLEAKAQAVVLHVRAEMARSSGQLGAADALYADALLARPSQWESAFRQGGLRLERQQYEPAVRALVAALRTGLPGGGGAAAAECGVCNSLGVALMNLGGAERLSAARTHYETAIRGAADGCPAAAANLARLLEALGARAGDKGERRERVSDEQHARAAERANLAVRGGGGGGGEALRLTREAIVRATAATAGAAAAAADRRCCCRSWTPRTRFSDRTRGCC